MVHGPISNEIAGSLLCADTPTRASKRFIQEAEVEIIDARVDQITRHNCKM
jgi:hypothetical protein